MLKDDDKYHAVTSKVSAKKVLRQIDLSSIYLRRLWKAIRSDAEMLQTERERDRQVTEPGDVNRIEKGI